MNIPWQELQPATLRAVIDEFVTRDGTDYGAKESAHETKIKQIYQLLREGKIRVVFDEETESCDIREVLNRRN